MRTRKEPPIWIRCGCFGPPPEEALPLFETVSPEPPDFPGVFVFGPQVDEPHGEPAPEASQEAFNGVLPCR